MSIPRIEVHSAPDALAAAAAERMVEACRRCLEEKETFALGLAGGSTPLALYRLLATDPWVRRIDWPRVEVFFGDERCVPPDHPQSNYALAKATLLDRVPIPGDNIYRMKGEVDPEAAAVAYGRMLKERFGEPAEPGLDLLLLGMGDDGHTLSLFPRTAALDETKHRCVANFVPRLDGGQGAWRITLTAPFANRSSEVLGLVTGGNKAAAVRQVLEGDAAPRDCPIKLIDPGEGRFLMLLDAAAAGMDEVPED
jgi:6-phosphogluconolactonase